MRKTSLFAALTLLALPAAAQVSTEAPKAAPTEERPTASQPAARRPLNLKLDNPSQYTTELPREKAGAGGLPALGADARPLPADAPNSVVPKDWQRER